MIFQERLNRHHDELRWLYMELYGNDVTRCMSITKQESKNCIIVMQNE